MKQHKVFIINTERETSRLPTAVRKQDWRSGGLYNLQHYAPGHKAGGYI